MHEYVVEQLPDALIFADRDGVIRLWNARAQALFGYSAAEALGQSLDLIIPERFRAAHWRGYREAIAAGRTRLSGDAMLTRGVYFHPYHFERWFISTVHDQEDVRRTLEAAYEAAEEVAKS